MHDKISFTRFWVHEPDGQAAMSEALERVLKSGEFILGKEVEAFEREYCNYLGVAAGAGVGSGTDAITLALLAGGIGPGDEVLIPDFSPGATASAVMAAGATPVLVDVDDYLGLDLKEAEVALTSRTKAVVVVHLYGRVDDMGKILPFCKTHGLWVIEDCAHAHGAKYWDSAAALWRMAGTLGHVGAFSFYPTKNLGGIGDSGFCCSNIPGVADSIRELRQYGWKIRNDSARGGRNSRMDEIQAAVLRAALPHLDNWNSRRQSLAEFYIKNLALPAADAGVVLPSLEPSRRHNFHQFVSRIPSRSASLNALSFHGIGYGIHYPKSLSQQVAYHAFGGTRSLATAKRAAAEVLSLPIHPWLHQQEACRVVEVLNKTWKK